MGNYVGMFEVRVSHETPSAQKQIGIGPIGQSRTNPILGTIIVNIILSTATSFGTTITTISFMLYYYN